MSSDQSYYIRSGLFSLFEKGSVFVFGFAATFVLLRAFSIAEFGTWALFLASTSFLEVGLIGLIQNAMVKYLATSDEENYSKITTASIVLNIILTTIFAILLFSLANMVSAWLNSESLGNLLRVYCLTMFVIIPFYQFNYIQQANLDFKGVFWSNFIRKGIFFGYILLFFLMGWKINVIDLAWLQVFVGSIAGLTSFVIGWPYLRFSKNIEWKWVQELFHYGKYVCGTNLSTMVYKIIDRLMLGGLLSEVAVGLYELAIRITNLIDVPALSIASVVFPQGAKKGVTDGKKGVSDLYEKSVAATLAFILPFLGCIMLFPEPIVLLIAGEKYLASVPILRWTILFGIFLPFAIQFGTILDAIGKPKINFLFTGIGMLVNVFFNYFFIKKFGVIGAAYGTLISYFVTFVIQQILLYKLFGIKAYRVFKHIPMFYKKSIKITKNYLKKNADKEIPEAEIPV